ncbi:MAG: hypothetical protein COZ93_07210, partial [Nitrospirae bacterium CG_4_8_14_3_um_filter_44_28]
KELCSGFCIYKNQEGRGEMRRIEYGVPRIPQNSICPRRLTLYVLMYTIIKLGRRGENGKGIS